MKDIRNGSSILLIQLDLEKLLMRIERSRCNENLKDFAYDVINRVQDVIDYEQMVNVTY